MRHSKTQYIINNLQINQATTKQGLMANGGILMHSFGNGYIGGGVLAIVVIFGTIIQTLLQLLRIIKFR